MFNADLLRLMQRIALGLPLALPTLAAPFHYAGCYPLGYTCPQEPVSVVVEYTSEGEGAVVDCAAACGDEAPCAVVDETHVECIRMIERCPAAGRRPVGPIQRTASDPERDPTSAWLFDALALEASAIRAFEELSSALERHGAPGELSVRARAAARDELRHTEAMAGLLARREARVSVRVSVAPGAEQSLYDVALLNVVEGCTRETFGAVEAALQSSRAVDLDVREAFATIARDEARHALLAFDVDAWARTCLDAADGVRLDEAREATIRELRQSLLERSAPAGLGLVSAAEAAALV